MGERPIHHLVIGLYAPTNPADPETGEQKATPAPVILSCSVPEPSAHRLREGLAGASQEVIPGTILQHLAQAFQRCDEISHNPPSARPEGDPEKLITVAEHEQVLDAIFDGGAHIARDIETGKLSVLPGPSPRFTQVDDALLADLADGKVHVIRNETGQPVIVEGSPPASLGDSDVGNVGADPLAGASGSPSNGSSGSTDGSAAGEKHGDAPQA